MAALASQRRRLFISPPHFFGERPDRSRQICLTNSWAKKFRVNLFLPDNLPDPDHNQLGVGGCRPSRRPHRMGERDDFGGEE
jgi:hypothetical protein